MKEMKKMKGMKAMPKMKEKKMDDKKMMGNTVMKKDKKDKY